MAQDLFDANAPRSDAMVRACSWCKRVQVDEVWMDVEQAIAESRLSEPPKSSQLTHGVCEPCAQKMLDSLARK